LTADRTALRRAVETYQPFGNESERPRSLAVLRKTRQFLHQQLSGHRRAIVYITTGFHVDDSEIAWTLRLDEREKVAAVQSERSATANASRSSYVPIFIFNPEGLLAQGPRDTAGGHGGLATLSTRNVQIHTLSRESGGRAVVETNAPERVVEDMFREQGSYYQLAYEQSYDLDGRYRRLQIEVKRPNATIVPRELMFVTPDPTKKTQRATVPTGVSSGLTAAISSAVSTGELPLRLAAVPVADPDPDSRTAAVALTLAVMLAPQPEAMDQEIATELLLFDGEGRKQVLRKAQSAKITAASAGGEREIATRLDLPPGRYNVRIAAARSGDQVTGSVYTTFTVPDFQRDALSLSGVAIGRAGGAAIGGREALVDVLPFAPTSIRDFARTDAVGALMRVYQSSRRPARQVTVVTHVIDEMGKEMLAQSSVYEAARFAAGKGVGHRFELPLATLEPGDYLLTFVASTGEGGAQAQREVRFAVR
jgi:hypothetical protein